MHLFDLIELEKCEHEMHKQHVQGRPQDCRGHAIANIAGRMLRPHPAAVRNDRRPKTTTNQFE